LNSRRQFLNFLAASPLLAGLPRLASASDVGDVVTAVSDAIDVFDFKATARSVVPEAHWGYLATGVNGDATLRANRSAFDHYYVRSQRLVDVSSPDMSVDIFGKRWPTPIVIAPVGSHKAYHPQGELAVARAAREKNHLQLLSTVASTPIEEVAEARGEPVWFQLYTSGGWPGVRRMLRRAEAAGSPVVVLTVDLAGGTSARHTLARAARTDTRNCASCHEGNGVAARTKPMFDGVFGKEGRQSMNLTWELVEQLKNETTMKVVIKGIVTAEDAERCLQAGVDGIIVSNHGGRGDESGRGAIDSLAEVATVAAGKTTLLMDSGIRRGVDVFKALALGANAVMIGRPYIWGLSSFGQSGVEGVLDIFTRELAIAMQSFGTPSLADISRDRIVRV